MNQEPYHVLRNMMNNKQYNGVLIKIANDAAADGRILD